MYVCISLYSLPFTGFESLPESVQTDLTKPPKNPQVICPRRGFRTTRASVEVLKENFLYYSSIIFIITYLNKLINY